MLIRYSQILLTCVIIVLVGGQRQTATVYHKFSQVVTAYLLNNVSVDLILIWS